MPLLWMYLCFSLNIAWQDLSLCLWLLYVFWVSPSAEGQDFANPESNPRPTPLETETPWGPVPAAPPFGAVVAPLPSPWPLPLMPLCFHHLRLWEDFTQGLGGRCSNLSKQKGGRRDPRSGPCSAPLPISRWSPHEVTCTCRFFLLHTAQGAYGAMRPEPGYHKMKKKWYMLLCPKWLKWSWRVSAQWQSSIQQ